MRVLVIGDTHIPDRASRLPPKHKQIIETGVPWDYVVFTGDLTDNSVFHWVKYLGKNVIVVRGNMDHIPLPKALTFSIEDWKIGVHHGDGVHPRGDPDGLATIARELNTTILVSGHTHSPFIKTWSDGKILLLNPGSLTGVWGGGGGSLKPSFMTLLKSGDELEIKLYELMGEEVVFKRIIVCRSGDKWVYS